MKTTNYNMLNIDAAGCRAMNRAIMSYICNILEDAGFKCKKTLESCLVTYTDGNFYLFLLSVDSPSKAYVIIRFTLNSQCSYIGYKTEFNPAAPGYGDLKQRIISGLKIASDVRKSYDPNLMYEA